MVTRKNDDEGDLSHSETVNGTKEEATLPKGAELSGDAIPWVAPLSLCYKGPPFSGE